MLMDQTAGPATLSYLQPNGTNIVSNLNPYAKEFYPSYMKSWRLKEEPEPKIIQPQQKTYTIENEMQSQQHEGKLQMCATVQELIDVKYNSTIQMFEYETRNLDTKIHIKQSATISKIAKPDGQRSIPITSVNNVERTRKTYTSNSNAKPNCLTTIIKSSSVPARNTQVLKLNSTKQPPAGTVSKICTSTLIKSKIAPKSVKPPVSLNGNSKEISGKSPNKDCLSIKSGTSSDKSSSSIKDNSSLNKATINGDKTKFNR